MFEGSDACSCGKKRFDAGPATSITFAPWLALVRFKMMGAPFGRPSPASFRVSRRRPSRQRTSCRRIAEPFAVGEELAGETTRP